MVAREKWPAKTNRLFVGCSNPARFEIESLKSLAAWAKKQGVSRSQAIPRLVELGVVEGEEMTA
jgi:hypothetical protein